ncbi:AraC family transcriptional regulator [Actinomadura rupiterrae]|uniref:AraC family transcriptional regulator n=1 Tax=Actinomadura rupiterrae TaxID=559627 RepID=UPI0020A296D9|nr:AraC family transcriptional regulator [Actinomadura rupiterrae]MCP2340161.1 AraC-like DNA-binding protein [Actinomadura rupiterrae]
MSVRFGAHSVRVLGDVCLGGRFVGHHCGRIGLHTLAYGADVEVVVDELPDVYIAHVPLAGVRGGAVDGVDVRAQGAIAGPGQRMAVGWGSGAATLVVCIPRDVVEGALGMRLGEASGPRVRFDPALRTGAGVGGEWAELIRRFAEFAGAELLDRSPLAVGHFEQLVVQGLLDVQPHSFSEVLASGGVAVAPRALRRALAFCEEHADEPITLADLAEAAHTSVRSLQEAYRTQLGTTPMAHLRQVRLRRAHEELRRIARGDGEGSVTDVALRWGFGHLGRFSAQYRDAFGELPSQTLRAIR